MGGNGVWEFWTAKEMNELVLDGLRYETLINLIFVYFQLPTLCLLLSVYDVTSCMYVSVLPK
jgi:hypothetical protein